MSRLSHWQKAIQKRFKDREDLGRARLGADYWPDLPQQPLEELFDFLELEYSLPPGLLRPEDPLAKLFARVHTRNPLRWMVYQVRSGDIQSELGRQLGERLDQHGTRHEWSRLDTLDDLARAWCGQGRERAARSVRE
jgi:hypothetical protein